MPSLQQLRYLVALTETKHFRRAAEACDVTQPTLSGQLKVLEETLGITLIERSRARVIVTPAGAEVADHARRVLREVEEIHNIAAAHTEPLKSTIKIGVVQSLGSYLLPLLVPDLHGSHPELKLYVREGLPATLLRDLDLGALELLIFPLPVKQAEFEALSLFREPLHVVVPRDHPFAQEADLLPEMLKGETILALERGHRMFDQISHICTQYGARLSNDYEGTSLDTLRQMVAMGMGVSLLPALYVQSEVAHQDIVVARSFRNTPPSRTIGMVWRQGTAREGDYRELAREICAILRRRAADVTVLN